MVAYHDLYDCRVDQWQKAADDWVDLARRSSSACEDIRAQGKKPLDDHWADATGKQAGKRLEDLADRLESGGDIMKGVAMVLDALAHSMGFAQRTLFHAAELAREHGLSIQDGHAVGAYTGAAPVGPNVPQNVRDAYTKELGHISEVNALIEEALREASQADGKASAELDKLATTINVADTSQAHNEILVEASHIEFDMLRADIPVGRDPHLQRAWWDGLTPQQQKDLMRADPVTLADLKGLPPEVGRELRGPTARSTGSRWCGTRWTTGTRRTTSISRTTVPISHRRPWRPAGCRRSSTSGWGPAGTTPGGGRAVWGWTGSTAGSTTPALGAWPKTCTAFSCTTAVRRSRDRKRVPAT